MEVIKYTDCNIMNNIINSIKNLFAIYKPFFEWSTWLHREDISDIYFNALLDEVKEAKDEYRKDNVVYLEDELGDIFWNYIMLLQSLETKGYIRSVENVFTHAEEKFKERVGFLDLPQSTDASKYWDDVKYKQKQRLKKEHEKLYGK